MKLVIFDFDGVLVNTLIMHYEISKEVNQKMSLNEFRSISNENIYDFLEKSTDIKMNPKFFEKYEEQSRELKIPEPLKEIVQELSKHYTLAIVTSTPSHLVGKILKQSNAGDYFSDILGSDVHTSKVVKNKMLLEKYKIAPEEVVYITDTVGDILEARECGIKSIAVTWGFHEEKTLREAKPEKVISNPADLKKAIEEFFND